MDMFKSVNFFDDYTFETRVMPAVTLMMPVILVALEKGNIGVEWSTVTVNIVVLMILTVFAGNIVRELGKRYGRRMAESLGALPTTIILRYSDDHVGDSKVKTYYHRMINAKLKNVQLPEKVEDESISSDSEYASAMIQLRIYSTAHRNTEFRIFQELKKYGYWRNLYGCKWYAIVIYAILVAREAIIIEQFSVMDLFLHPFPKYDFFLVYAIWTILFMKVVTKQTVENNAFDYAKALLEVIETYNNSTEQEDF